MTRNFTTEGPERHEGARRDTGETSPNESIYFPRFVSVTSVPSW